MKLFFALTDKLEEFSAERHKRIDAQILSLHIHEKEGKTPSATLTIAKNQNLLKKSWGILSAEMRSGETCCLFRGNLIVTPTDALEFRIKIKLIGHPPDASGQKRKLLEAHKATNLYEPLLVPPHLEEDPKLILLTQPADFYTDRVKLQISISSKFQGRENFALSANSIFSIDIHKKYEPAPGVSLILRAEWVQRVHGFIDLSRPIRRLFKNGDISTYTQKSFERYWPKVGQTIGRSGYWVTTSELEEAIIPSKPSYLKLNHVGRKRNAKLAKKTYFKAKLHMGWSVKQKRKEELTLNLAHKTQQNTQQSFPKMIIGLQRRLSRLMSEPFWTPHTLYSVDDTVQEDSLVWQCVKTHTSGYLFRLNDACWKLQKGWSEALPNQNAGSFFSTNRGKKLIGCAVEMAKTAVAEKARPYSIELDLDPEIFPSLSTDSNISLEKTALSPKPCHCKVVEISFFYEADQGKAILKVTGASSIGAQETAPITTTIRNNYAEDYATAWTAEGEATYKTPSGLTIGHYPYPEDASDFSWIKPGGLIPKITLENGPESQERKLRKGVAENHSKLGTCISINMPALTSQNAIERAIKVSDTIYWHSPAQIQITESQTP